MFGSSVSWICHCISCSEWYEEMSMAVVWTLTSEHMRETQALKPPSITMLACSWKPEFGSCVCAAQSKDGRSINVQESSGHPLWVKMGRVPPFALWRGILFICFVFQIRKIVINKGGEVWDGGLSWWRQCLSCVSLYKFHSSGTKRVVSHFFNPFFFACFLVDSSCVRGKRFSFSLIIHLFPSQTERRGLEKSWWSWKLPLLSHCALGEIGHSVLVCCGDFF